MEKGIDWLSPSKSYYNRVVFILLPFTVFVCLLYSLLIIASIQFVEDQIINDYLEREWLVIESQFRSGVGNITLPSTSYISSYRESDKALPPEFLSLSVGTYEYVHNHTKEGRFPKIKMNGHDFGSDKHDYHLLVAQVNPHSEKIYLLLNENNLSSINQYETLVLSIIYAIAGIVIIMGSLLAFTLARYISGPIHTLNNEVQSSEWQTSEFNSQSRQDEIGELASSFANLLGRLRASIEREKAFTRHASHELRTPLSLANNALSVLKLDTISQEKRFDNLERMTQSFKEMEDLIDVFLCLGREDRTPSTTPINVKQLIESSISKYHHQLDSTQEFTLNIEQVEVNGHYSLLKITIDNLIRNSVYHGTGTIEIHLNNNRFTISNHCKSDTHGHGYGLEILDRIANTMNWNLRISRDHKEFRVDIDF